MTAAAVADNRTPLLNILGDLPPEWQPHYHDVLHPSSLSANPPCPRAYLYANRLRWLPYSHYKGAANLGTFTHKMFAILFAGGSFTAAVDVAAQRLAEDIRTANWTPAQQADAALRFNVARAIVAQWLYTYGHPQEKIDSGEWTVLAIEQTAQIVLNELYNVRGVMVGTVDLAILTHPKGKGEETPAPGDVWLWDHKTCSESAPERARGMCFDVQSKCYRLLWDATHRDMPAVGIVHNILMKPGIRLKQKELVEDYILRVGDWFKAKLESDPSAYPVARSFQRFMTPLQGDLELGVIITSAAGWASKPAELYTFPRNRLACRQHNRMCPYIHLCESCTSRWPTLLVEGIPSAEGKVPLYTKGDDPLTAAVSASSDAETDTDD